MQFEHLDSYESAIRQVVNWVAPYQGEIDVFAHDRSDYVAKLRYESWAAQIRFRETHGYCSPAERRYVHQSLWNKARDWRRRRFVHERQLRNLQDVDSTYDSAGQIEAREILAGLKSYFDERDFDVLSRVGQSGGKVSEAHDAECDGTYVTFSRRVRTLRSQAKQWATTSNN